MHFLIGDLQGCGDAFDRLLEKVAFSASRDSLTVLGDLVNRGPQSLAVLRRVRGLGSAADALLGNHDLHLLAVAHGVRPAHRSDTLNEILESPERDAWLEWLRARPLALERHGWLCVHAGVNPAWTSFQTLALAAEVEALLRGPDLAAFLPQMYGNQPARWSNALQGAERWRHVINVLRKARTPHRPASCPGSRRRSARAPAAQSRSATGPRSASSTALTCSASTPAASGVAPSPPCVWTAGGAR
jgi:bis(5'-nucleosyl)-tetraphosphatase (symmetrical)